jgi:hypothetical protein
VCDPPLGVSTRLPATVFRNRGYAIAWARALFGVGVSAISISALLGKEATIRYRANLGPGCWANQGHLVALR